jgi:hypothetical protein
MSKNLLKALIVSPTVLGAFMVSSGNVIAADVTTGSNSVAGIQDIQVSPSGSVTLPAMPAPQAPDMVLAQTFSSNTVVPAAAPADSTTTINQLSRYGSEGRPNPMSQVTSVSQLSDVQPTDWAYQSLQSLVERYGCIVGYPDGTFRGNRPLSRFEFAAGLNACMDKVSELIAQGTADLVSKDDLAALQKLQEEFSAELATLRGRVDALEARTATLEAQQFSTTTKLAGEAIFAITDNFGGTNGVPSSNTVFLNRVRLNFLTSFTGKDTLWTRLQVGNSTGVNSLGGDPQSGQTFDFGSGGTNFILDTLNYTFPLGDKLKIAVEANAGYWPDLIPTLNPYFEDYDGGQGSLSLFGQRNPIYRIGDGAGAGVLFSYDFTDAISLSGGYMANTKGASPGVGDGLFNGSYSALAQLTFRPNDRIGIGVTYNRGYFNSNAHFLFLNNVGTDFANIGGVQAYTTDSIGASATFALTPQIVINGWFNYTRVNATSGGGFADIYSYALGLALPDFGKKGNVLGVLVGAQPYTGAAGGGLTGTGNATPFHVEGFYRYQVTDNISITPGIIWLTAPGQSSANDDVFIGTLRTTFLF